MLISSQPSFYFLYIFIIVIQMNLLLLFLDLVSNINKNDKGGVKRVVDYTIMLQELL